MEAFYGTHRAPVRVELCPLADPSLVEQLGQRRYRVTEFNNVLVRRMEGAAIPPAETSVRLTGPDEGTCGRSPWPWLPREGRRSTPTR